MEVVYKKPKMLTDTPLHYCPGCTHGIVHKLIAQVLEELGKVDGAIGVVPVGCAVFGYKYFKCDVFEAAHGRAPATASAIRRVVNPDNIVFTYQGDGDLASIGMAETVHACMRGENITIIFINNGIYGMTGGQYSPTTPHGEKGTTAPYGNIDRPFDIAALAAAAGASYVAKGSAYHAAQTTKFIQDGIAHKGFSLIDCAGVCATYYGRKNKKGSAVDMMKYQRDNAITVEKAREMTAEEKKGKIIIGKVCEEDYPELTEQYQKIIDRLMEAKK